MPILQTKKPRPREVKQLVEGQRALQWEIINPCLVKTPILSPHKLKETALVHANKNNSVVYITLPRVIWHLSCWGCNNSRTWKNSIVMEVGQALALFRRYGD